MLPNQVQVRLNTYCQQRSEDKVEIIHFNTTLMEINVKGELDKKELHALGASMLSAMDRFPASRDRLFECEKEDNLDEVVYQVERLKKELKYGEKVEIGINEETNMVYIGICKAGCKSLSHQKDVVYAEAIDFDKLQETADKMGCYYVPREEKEQECPELE